MLQDDPQDSLCKAAKFVDQAVGIDNSFLDLSVLLGTDTFNEPSIGGHETIGGCEVMEYPNTNFQIPNLTPLKVKVLPIELQEKLKQFQCSCLMGVFTEIDRAWITIDNELYLWTYDDGSDIAYFDGLSEVILSVALVCPKPNVFQSHISHLLCIATPIEVIILGVTFAASTGSDGLSSTLYSDLQILHEPLYALATDNVHMTAIIGTKGGRIFMAGKDGCLYEFDYQGDFGWFGKRSCRKINHSTSFSSYILPSFMSSYFSEEDPLVQLCCDESRKLLIARSHKSNIQIFYLGRDGEKFNKIASLNYERTIQKVHKVDKTRLGSIVHVAPVPASDSERIHLVATTTTGTRLYYTTRGYSDAPQHPSSPPNCLTLVHIRVHPNFNASTSPQRFTRTPFSIVGQPNDVHLAAYSQGTHLMSSSNLTNDGDTLWTFSHDSFPLGNILKESYESTQLAGKVWEIREVDIHDSQTLDLIREPLVIDHKVRALGDATQGLVLPDPPAVITQHYRENKKFAVVSSIGVCIAMKLSPSEQLQQLLLRHSVDSDPVKSYFRQMQEQALTSCLALMCSKNSSHLQVNSMATRAYNIYKWEAAFNQAFAPEQTSTPMAVPIRRNLNFQQQASPISQFGIDIYSTSLNHRSMYLYMARILRPVWHHKVVTSVIDPESGSHFLTSRLNSDQILLVLQRCQDFLQLLQSNPSIIAHVPNPNPGISIIVPESNFSMSRNASVRGMDFETDEIASLRCLESLLNICCQCLSMWKLLADHQFHIVVARLKQEDKDILVNLSFSQLVVTSQSLCKQLIAVLLDFYIDDNAVTDVISSRLRDSCPNLYSSQDQAQTKGNEYLKLAKMTLNPVEKGKLIQNAVQQYKITLAGPNMSIQHQLLGDLPTMCTRLASVGAYLGLIDLALTAASKCDPNKVAQHFYLHSKPQEDLEGVRFYAMRSECYKPIVESLDYLVGLCAQAAEPKARESLGRLITGIIPSFFSSGSPGDKEHVTPLTNGYVMTAEEANNQIEEMVKMIMKSEDQMAHFALFEWMNAKGLSERLLDLPSPYLEQYLKLESDADTLHQLSSQQVSHKQLIKQKDMLDLLANYYIKEKKFSMAARILDSLATKAGTHMNLKERLNYMSRAALCLQSSASRADSEFMHEVQDKVEVILLQIEVVKGIEKCTLTPKHILDDAIQLLDSKLFDISELYSHFAIQFELSACKLAILHSSGIRDPNLIDLVWKEIIDKELQSSESKEAHQRIELLRCCIVSLGKMYLKEENYFPLELLVKHLEQLSLKNGFCDIDFAFVARTFLEVGVSVHQLHDIYEKLFRQKDAYWKSNKKPYHLVEVDAFIMRQFLDEFSATKLDVQKKGPMLTRSLDGISFYLVELQGHTNGYIQLVNELKGIQIKMERLERCQ